MLTIDSIISLVGLCIACFSLGYMLGSSKDYDRTKK